MQFISDRNNFFFGDNLICCTNFVPFTKFDIQSGAIGYILAGQAFQFFSTRKVKQFVSVS